MATALDTLDTTALRAACREVAVTQVRGGGTGNVDENSVDELTEALLNEAVEAMACSAVCDLPLVVRAIGYLADVHSIPQRGNRSTEWFFDMVMCVHGLVSPGGRLTRGHEPFLRDIENGVAAARAAWEKG